MTDNNKKSRQYGSFAVVAQSIKNPIYIAKEYLEALIAKEYGELNEKQEEYIRDSLENINRMTDILGNILFLLKLEKGDIEVPSNPVNANEAIKWSVDKHMKLAETSNTEIFFDEPDKEVPVMMDIQNLRYIMKTLLVNAVTYKSSDKGVVKVSLSLNDGEMVCSVEDNGIGVSQEDKEYILHSIHRSDEAMEVDPTGLGVDLYMCRMMVELSKGKMWLEDGDEGGAKFVFTLPVVS